MDCWLQGAERLERVACERFTLASINPLMQLTWSSSGNEQMLFWNGYGTHRFFIHTYDTRSWTAQCSSPVPTAASISWSK